MAGIAGQYHQIGPIRLEGKCWPIRIWDVRTGENIRIIEGHTNMVISVAWSPDSNWIASGSLSFFENRPIRIWNANESLYL